MCLRDKQTELFHCYVVPLCMHRRQEIHSSTVLFNHLVHYCQGDDRQESCSSAGNCQADEQTLKRVDRGESDEWSTELTLGQIVVKATN